MSERAEILRALRGREWVSLATIADACAMRASDTENALRTLRGDGLAIEENHRNEFCLREPVSPMDSIRLKNALHQSGYLPAGRFELLDSVDSTSSWLDRQAQSGLSIHRLACLSEFQSAGRGRRGRHWQGAPYKNIMLSLGWEFSGSANTLAGLSLSLGVVIADGIQSLTGAPIRLKWPNDLWCRNRKLGGILVEAFSSGSATTRAIMGIGINICPSEVNPVDAGYSVTDLTSECVGPVPAREEIAAAVLGGISERLERFLSDGFSADLKRFNELDIFLNQEICLSSAQGERIAVGLGADESGAYRLNTRDGEHIINAGELSLSLRDNSLINTEARSREI
ncbi:MAG: biotin--[acetyl-CoA-carboxylase] ligase [Gammaproteobacteria bacterium]